MLRGRPAALVVVCVLAMACLLGDGAARARSSDLVRVLEILIDDAASCADSRLYTPTYVDYKTCPKDTLECFSAEVRVLVTECERTEDDDGLEKLERGLKYYLESEHHRNQSQSTCGPCELHPEENVGRFLRELQQTVMASNF
ncbi:interleukin 15, like isoform X2 [Hippocampus zosterae]|uniref:interleukin 15, like isoform X2 n=1 Tax=Hippocampus zosterae TaxID=109293 RepID=UPI00223DB2C9|nr:interleukin 15, like isoform X2 [Hippocampus zosterae]